MSDPATTPALFEAALSAHQTGRLSEAEQGYLQVLSVDERHASATHLLGVVHLQRGNLAAAEQMICKALTLKEDAFFLGNLGTVLKESGRLPEAEVAYRHAVAIKPDYADAHNNLGVLYRDSKRLPQAEAAYRRALEIRPGFADAHNNLGVLLKDSNRLSEAEAAYRRALEIQPDFADAHNNLGVLFKETNRLPEAEMAYQRAMTLKPDFVDPRFNLSLLLLSMSRYDEAWPLYESRYAPEKKETVARIPKLASPQWQGESLAGKSLLIWPEQGFGDYIQFVRYAALLKARGVSHLTVVCGLPLAPLLETVEGVDAVLTDQTQIPPHDYWSFVLSVPLHFATTAQTIPLAPLPYVHALPVRVAQWHERLPATGRKVGLVWKGSAGHKNDGNRSLPGLASLAPLWSAPGVTFISLQKGQAEDEASQPPAGQPLVALGAQMQDFADAAAIVSQLDLVICVDTAMAHLAGALGKPCWVLLPRIGTDWRWLLNRTDSPWYPATRLFRQSDLQDWSGTIGEVADALNVWARGG